MKKSNVSALSFLMAVVIGLTFCISPAFAENSSVVLDSGQSVDLRGTPDSTPPVLKSVNVDKTAIEAPGKIICSVNATDDVSGLYWLSVNFVNRQNGRTLEVQPTRLTESDVQTLEIDISQFEPSGEFYLESVSLLDNSGNRCHYYSKYYPYISEDDLVLPQEVTFRVSNGDDSEFTTNTTSSTLVSDIKQQPDDATVYINYKTGSNLTADVFEAIKGTNKTIIFENDGIQWEFNGKDIEASKSIDLNVSIDKISSSLTGNAQNIQNISEGCPYNGTVIRQ